MCQSTMWTGLRRLSLRGMRTATVIQSTTPAMQLAAAGGLLAGAAGITDKLADGDLPAPLRPAARRRATSFQRAGTRLSQRVGMPTGPVLDAPARAAAVEAGDDVPLDDLLAPTGEAVHTPTPVDIEFGGRPQ